MMTINYTNPHMVKPETFRELFPTAKYHHTAKYPAYCSVKDESPFYEYSGRYGTGFVRFRPLNDPGASRRLCYIEYWIYERKSE